MYLMAVEQRLKDAEIFEQVGSATSFAALKKKVSNKSTMAYVIPVIERISTNEKISGVLEQHSIDSFAVVIAVKDRRDAHGESGSKRLDDLRRAVRSSLFGWSPAEGYQPILLDDGRLLALDDFTVFWQDKFQTAHFETGNYQ